MKTSIITISNLIEQLKHKKITGDEKIYVMHNEGFEMKISGLIKNEDGSITIC
ncbi:MAG: hypothetical protein ACOC22_02900 [bacterium]